jgi:hypothetical protein
MLTKEEDNDMKTNRYLTLPLVAALLLGFGSSLVGCSDDDGCHCVLSFTTINDMPAGQVGELDITDDRNSTLDGFQIDVAVAASCLGDGDEVTLSGGDAPQVAVVSDNVAVFTAYTIPVEVLVNLQISGPVGCVPATHGIRVIDHSRVCRFVEYLTGEPVSCANDDTNAAAPGLQLDLTVACSDVDDGQSVTLYRDGQEVDTGTLSAGAAQFEDVFIIGGGTNCNMPVLMEAVVDTGSGTELVPLTLSAECCDAPGCEVFGYSPSDPITGMFHPNTFNISTDGDTFTAGMQTQVGVDTDSARVWKVGVRVTDLATSNSQVYYVENIVGDQTLVGSSPIDLPEGDVLLEPLCVLQGQTDPFAYADQQQVVYVDTVAPDCPTNLSCTVGNPRVAELTCDWVTPDDPDADPDIETWDARSTTAFSDQADCTETNLAAFWPNLNQLVPPAPARDYLDPISHMFTNLNPGLDYCIGIKAVDYAGNESECITPYWVGEITVRESWLAHCTTPPCNFGSAIASADVNCDGYSDLIVGAREVEAGGDPNIADGEAYIYFGSATGIQDSASPDVTITPAVPDGVLGWSMTGLGNFTGHTNNCEDFAIGAHYRNNGDPPSACTWGGCNSGAVFIFKGKTNWNASIADTDADAIVFYNATGRHGWEAFGYDVAVAGDFDNDGRPDMAVSAMLDENRGAVYIMKGQDIPYQTGSPTLFGVPADMDLKLIGDSNITTYCPLEELGASISPAGDLDGDNYDDIIIGAPGNDLVCYSDGKAYVLFGAAFGGSMDVVDVLNDPQNRVTAILPDSGNTITGTESIGGGVAGLGDINGDGFLDIAVSDPDYDATPLTDSGAVFVFFGDSNGFRGGTLEVDQAGLWIRSTEASNDRFGISVAFSVEVLGTQLGDFDGDGLPDLFVGAEQYGVHQGSVFFLYSSTSLTPIYTWINWNAASFWISPPAPCGRWGSEIRYIGDTNGDGYVDVAVADDTYAKLPPCSEAEARGRMAVLY